MILRLHSLNKYVWTKFKLLVWHRHVIQHNLSCLSTTPCKHSPCSMVGARKQFECPEMLKSVRCGLQVYHRWYFWHSPVLNPCLRTYVSFELLHVFVGNISPLQLEKYVIGNVGRLVVFQTNTWALNCLETWRKR